jgi:hypothetical protein
VFVPNGARVRWTTGGPQWGRINGKQPRNYRLPSWSEGDVLFFQLLSLHSLLTKNLETKKYFETFASVTLWENLRSKISQVVM